MTLKILNNQDKSEILEKLKNQFGIQNFPENTKLAQRGEEKIFLFTGNLSEIDISNIEQISIIEGLGVYLGKIDDATGQMRLSIEGVHIFKDQISKNIFELNNEQTDLWMKGQELNISTGKRDFLIMKNNEDFIGCGKASENKISNFIPKSRRLKEKN